MDVLFECSMIGIGRDSLFRSCGNSQPNKENDCHAWRTDDEKLREGPLSGQLFAPR